MVSRKNGFTFIELLVTLVILGVLAAIALPKYAGSRDKAKLAALRSDVRNVASVEEAYFSDYGSYGTLAQLQADGYASPPGITLIVTTPSSAAFSVVATDPSISSSPTGCTVQSSTVASATDGVISCP